MSFRHEIESNLEKELAATKARGLYRSIKPQPADRVDFVTNDYLCLSRREELVNAAVLAARNEGAGARAARLLGGDGAAHRAAEARCAKWMKTESALLLPSGSQANFAILGALLREGDCVFSDIHNHASIVDGIRLTKARRFIYSALEDLEDQLLSASSARRRIIITDAIFSIDGRFAELNEIVALAEMYKAGVVVDEAHAAGVVGPKGRGLCAREGVDDRVLARVVTGGKALGVAGAFIVGSRFVIDSVINYSRAFIFTTAPPAPVAAALAAAIEIVENADAERARLQHLQQFFHKQLESNGIEVEERNCPIVYIELGSAMRAAAVAESLQNELLDIRAIRPPTVPVGWSGLRIVVHADHTEEILTKAAAAIARACEKFATDSWPDLDRDPPIQRFSDAIYVIGTDTGVGKSFIACALAAIALENTPVCYWKPVQSGSGDDNDSNTIAARFESIKTKTRFFVYPPAYAFPHPIAPEHAAARDGVIIQKELLLQKTVELAENLREHARLIIEGVGGLCVPFSAEYSQEQFVADLTIPTVLVARSGIGTLNHTRLTLDALRARGIGIIALVLVGDPDTENKETLGRYFDKNRILTFPRLEKTDLLSIRRAALDAKLDRIFTNDFDDSADDEG